MYSLHLIFLQRLPRRVILYSWRLHNDFGFTVTAFLVFNIICFNIIYFNIYNIF